MSKTKALRTVSEKRLKELKPFLDETVQLVEQPSYISTDPVCFMYSFSDTADRALDGFFSAIMAWGRRDIVLNKVGELIERMNNQPSEFIRNFSDNDFSRIKGFKHRTFKDGDVYWLIKTLSEILNRFDTFERFWETCADEAQKNSRPLMAVFHDRFFSFFPEIPQRVRKHISNPDKNSSCKRLWLYLRWCIRSESSVDTGIMNFIEPSDLMIPLDVHVARVARIMGLLSRRQNDWKSVLELTQRLKILNIKDPVRYDYALFGLGALDLEIPGEFIVNKV